MTSTEQFHLLLQKAIPTLAGKLKPLNYVLQGNKHHSLTTNGIPQIRVTYHLRIHWEDGTVSSHELTDVPTMDPQLWDEWRSMRFFHHRKFPFVIHKKKDPVKQRFDPIVAEMITSGALPEWMENYQVQLSLDETQYIHSNGTTFQTNRTELVLRSAAHWSIYRHHRLPDKLEQEYLQSEHKWLTHQAHNHAPTLSIAHNPNHEQFVLFCPEALQTVQQAHPSPLGLHPYRDQCIPFYNWLQSQQEVLLIPSVLMLSNGTENPAFLAPTVYHYQIGRLIGKSRLQFSIQPDVWMQQVAVQAISKVGWNHQFGLAFSSGLLVLPS